MDERRTVIHESHGFGLGKPGPVTTGNECDAQAVKAGGNSSFPKDGIDAPVFVGAKNARKLSSYLYQPRQSGPKMIVDRYRKKLPWIIVFSLGISQANTALREVNIFNRNGAFGEPAASVERNFKSGSHPFGLIPQFVSNSGNVGVGQFRFFLLAGASNAETRNRVGFGKLATDRFVHQLRQEFDFEQSGIVNDRAPMNRICQAPADIRLAVRVFDLAGVNDAFGGEERSQGLPSGRVSALGIAALRPVRGDVTWNPRKERRGSIRPANTPFVNGRFVGKALRFSGVGRVIRAEAGGFFNPNARIEVALPKIPERGAFMPSDGRHCAKVSDSLTGVKVFPVAKSGLFRRKRGEQIRAISTITPRGSLFPCKTGLSLTSVSQIIVTGGLI